MTGKAMTITTIDKATAKAIGEEVRALLATYAASRGLTVQMFGGKYSPLTYAPKIEFGVAAAADGRSAAQVEFEQYCHLFGLEKEHFGRTFMSHGHTFTVSGLGKGRSSKVLATRDDGKLYQFRSDDIARLLGVVPPASALVEVLPPRF